MILSKLVYDIREALKEYSDDTELSDRYIEFLISIKRSKFLRQELDKFGRKFNNTILQTFCSDIELVSSNECGLDLTCDKVARTKLAIPTLLQLSTRDALSRVAPADKLAKPFTLIDRNRASFAGDSIFNKSIKSFLHDDDRLYFIGPEDNLPLECVSITGVFEEPSELKKYSNCCGCENESENLCYDVYKDPYPVSPHLIDIIRKDIIRDVMGGEKLQEDIQNDAQNED